jgi:RimJ/RimL family protein N-acetyltransferase
LVIQGISQEQDSKRQSMQDASDFFVDAFWTSKVGGGAQTLTKSQERTLQQSQYAEFNRRYGGRRAGSELLVGRNAKNEIVACAGVEVDRIPVGSLKGPIEKQAPLMSNLAIGRKYRRRGLAEQMVQAVEKYVQTEWGYEECYLYVEERNRPAVKLYEKLGYRKKWSDFDAKTLMPTNEGDLLTSNTVIVCMEKKLRSGFWSRLFR